MSLIQLTRYNFSVEHGITGNLLKDPVFEKTKSGEEYAKLAVYCKSADERNDERPNFHRRNSADTPEHQLTAYVRVYDKTLLNEVEKLKQGYFVNFKFDRVTFAIGHDEETKQLGVVAFVTAIDFAVRHIPGSKAKSNQKSYDRNGERSARKNSFRRQA